MFEDNPLNTLNDPKVGQTITLNALDENGNEIIGVTNDYVVYKIKSDFDPEKYHLTENEAKEVDEKYDNWFKTENRLESLGLTRFQYQIFRSVSSLGLFAGYPIKNDIFGVNQILSNGYEVDRQQREVLDWGLYNADGSPKETTDGYEGEIEFNGNVATTQAQAFWYYLLKSYGIGDRTITSFWRQKESDTTYFYGFMEEKYKKQVKYMQLKDESGKEINIEVIFDGTSNLFYLEEQGDSSTKVTLEDEGYVSWATNKEIMGMFINSLIPSGNSPDGTTYDVNFIDADGNIVTDANGNNLFSLGEENNGFDYLGENRKLWTSASSYFERQPDGSVKLIVKKQFNI